MTRLFVHVEGITEETFVNEVLRDHLVNHGYCSISARLVGNARQRRSRGGIKSWPSVRNDIVNHLKRDQGTLNTTLVDYYGLPSGGDRGWPGRDAATSLPFLQKPSTVEIAILNDVQAAFGPGFDRDRFIPYVMMHEFEGMLFSDCSRFGIGIGRRDLTPRFQAIRDTFGSPEEINDSPHTAPSKRIAGLMPGYNKPVLGTLAVLEIGLEAIRAECPHFRQWLEQLEAWPKLH